MASEILISGSFDWIKVSEGALEFSTVLGIFFGSFGSYNRNGRKMRKMHKRK